MATQSSVLKAYNPLPYPQIAGADPKYWTEQLRQISVAINLLVQVTKQIDARLIAASI